MTGVLVPLSEMNTNVVILRAEGTIADIDLRGPHKQGICHCATQIKTYFGCSPSVFDRRVLLC